MKGKCRLHISLISFSFLVLLSSLLPHSDFSHSFVYLISFLIDKLSWEVTQSLIIQRNVYIIQINIIENYGLGSVFITYTSEKNDYVLSSKYMQYLNNVIPITKFFLGVLELEYTDRQINI